MTKHVHMTPLPSVHHEPKRPWLFWLALVVIMIGGAVAGFIGSGAG